MKTNEELLKFYGVEIGNKYLVTDVKNKMFYSYRDEFFDVYKFDHGTELHVRFCEEGVRNHKIYDLPMSVLNYLDYILYQDNILDKKEKEYLRNVIDPFRKKYLIKIAKHKTEAGCEFIRIKVIDFVIDNKIFNINLPHFPKHSMYKKMKLDYCYSLRELNLYG